MYKSCNNENNSLIKQKIKDLQYIIVISLKKHQNPPINYYLIKVYIMILYKDYL